MPALRLTATPVAASAYCVLGITDPKHIGSPSSPAVIRHVGLLSPARGTAPASHDVYRGGQNHCDHVRRAPDLDGHGDVLGARIDLNAPLTKGVVVALGHAGPTPDYPFAAGEVAEIEAFIEFTKGTRIGYICNPPVQEADPDTGKPVPRYSCVGFVLRCYQEAGIELLSPVENNIAYPAFTLQELIDIWPEINDLNDYGLAQIGLTPNPGRSLEESTWQVVVPGYVLHAIHNGPGNTPYQPTSKAEISY